MKTIIITILSIVLTITVNNASAYNAEIYKAQQELSRLGYAVGVVDGIYGRKTKNALKKYQRAHNLRVSGRLDAKTKALLFKGLKKQGKISPAIFRLLNKVYSNYDNNRKCWVFKDTYYYYCMKITKSNIIHTKSGKRNYLVLTSNALDESGKEAGIHTFGGAVGLFIIKLKNTKLLAAEPNISLGMWGWAPEKWNLIKLGSSDYWGWQTIFHQNYSGYGATRSFIFAPYGKGIKELTNIVLDYGDGGVMYSNGVEGSTEIVTKIKVDKSQVSKRVFPLKVKVTGKLNGKKLKVKTWTLPFNTRKWQYIKPKHWPLSGLYY
jgi:hypothetical protein